MPFDAFVHFGACPHCACTVNKMTCLPCRKKFDISEWLGLSRPAASFFNLFRGLGNIREMAHELLNQGVQRKDASAESGNATRINCLNITMAHLSRGKRREKTIRLPLLRVVGEYLKKHHLPENFPFPRHAEWYMSSGEFKAFVAAMEQHAEAAAKIWKQARTMRLFQWYSSPQDLRRIVVMLRRFIACKGFDAADFFLVFSSQKDLEENGPSKQPTKEVEPAESSDSKSAHLGIATHICINGNAEDQAALGGLAEVEMMKRLGCQILLDAFEALHTSDSTTLMIHLEAEFHPSKRFASCIFQIEDFAGFQDYLLGWFESQEHYEACARVLKLAADIRQIQTPGENSAAA